MTTSVLLGRILAAGAVVEAAAGLGLLLAPSTLVELLLRGPLAGAGPIIARFGGGGLLALGIACWFARRTRGLTHLEKRLDGAWARSRTSVPGYLTAGCDSSHDTLNAQLTHLPTHTGL